MKFDFPSFHLRKKIIESFINKISSAKIGVDDVILGSLNKEYALLKTKEEKLKSLMSKEKSILDSNALWNDKKIIENRGILFSTRGYTGADLERGVRVALFKALKSDILTYENFVHSLELVGGTRIHVEQQYFLSASERKYSGDKKILRINHNNLEGPREI